MPSSARLLRSFISTPDTARAISLMPPTSRTGSPPADAAAHGELAARLGEIALELAALVLDQRGETLGRLLDRRLQQAGDFVQRRLSAREMAARRIARSSPRDGARPPRRRPPRRW